MAFEVRANWSRNIVPAAGAVCDFFADAAFNRTRELYKPSAMIASYDPVQQAWTAENHHHSIMYDLVVQVRRTIVDTAARAVYRTYVVRHPRRRGGGAPSASTARHLLVLFLLDNVANNAGRVRPHAS